MSDAHSLFDSLCDKLTPYVRSAVAECPYEDLVTHPKLVEMSAEQLEGIVKEEIDEEITEGRLDEEDKEIAKHLLYCLYNIFRTLPHLEVLDSHISICTDIIASDWSEVLRGAYKENNEQPVRLRDCLLPDNLRRYERAWHLDIDRTGLSQEQIEDMLRKFGQKEISDKLELPWGGYVKRVGAGYELRKSDLKKECEAK